MEKKLIDYAHYYLGGEVLLDSQHWEDNTVDTFNGIRLSEIESGFNHRLVLRPIMDMTEQEARDMVMAHPFYGKHETMHWEYYRRAVHFKVIYTGQSRRWCKQIAERGETPEQFKYLLSKGFDLFNLIPEGLAIDATKFDINSLIINP